MNDTYYGVDDSELQSLLSSECTLAENEVNNVKRRIKMDGYYVSKGRLEEIIREAEKVGEVFYVNKEKVAELRSTFNELLDNLYEIRHDSSNFVNKYGWYKWRLE